MTTKPVQHQSHGVPLEDYEVTRHDHVEQRTWEGIAEHVAGLLAAERAKEDADPELKQRRDRQVEEVWTMILRGKRPEHEIMRWRVRLYCGHIVETHRHIDCASPRDHGSSSMTCPTCGRKPSGIVAWEPIGLKAPPPVTTPARPQVGDRRPTRTELERQVRELQEEVQRLRRDTTSG